MIISVQGGQDLATGGAGKDQIVLHHYAKHPTTTENITISTSEKDAVISLIGVEFGLVLQPPIVCR